MPSTHVTLLSRWDGFCLSCGGDGQPLALTWSGRRGLLAWLSGLGWKDGELRLTCVGCGGVQVVGWDDEQDPLPLLDDPLPVVAPVGLDGVPAPEAAVVPAQRDGAEPLAWAAQAEPPELVGDGWSAAAQPPVGVPVWDESTSWADLLPQAGQTADPGGWSEPADGASAGAHSAGVQQDGSEAALDWEQALDWDPSLGWQQPVDDGPAEWEQPVPAPLPLDGPAAWDEPVPVGPAAWDDPVGPVGLAEPVGPAALDAPAGEGFPVVPGQPATAPAPPAVPFAAATPTAWAPAGGGPVSADLASALADVLGTAGPAPVASQAPAEVPLAPGEALVVPTLAPPVPQLEPEAPERGRRDLEGGLERLGLLD